jgi:hypothetical protein
LGYDRIIAEKPYPEREKRMHEVCIYQIEVRGQVDENDLNAMSPLQIMVERSDPTATLTTICADQSALVGLVRHLHGRGFVLLSLHREG